DLRKIVASPPNTKRLTEPRTPDRGRKPNSPTLRSHSYDDSADCISKRGRRGGLGRFSEEGPNPRRKPVNEPKPGHAQCEDCRGSGSRGSGRGPNPRPQTLRTHGDRGSCGGAEGAGWSSGFDSPGLSRSSSGAGRPSPTPCEAIPEAGTGTIEIPGVD